MEKRAFCCGSVAADWFDTNCERCAKFGTYDNINCPYAKEIVNSFFTGTVSEKTYTRILNTDSFWCQLFEPRKEYKEYRKIEDQLETLFEKVNYYHNDKVNAIIAETSKKMTVVEKHKLLKKFKKIVKKTNLVCAFSIKNDTIIWHLDKNFTRVQYTGKLLFIADIKSLKSDNYENLNNN